MKRRSLFAAMMTAWLARLPAWAEDDPVAPIRGLCDALLAAMKLGHGVTPAQRFDVLAPELDRALDLTAILRASVGPGFAALPADSRDALEEAYRRYAIASYAVNFDSFTGQRFEVDPRTRTLPNGDVVVHTQIVPPDGAPHDLDYVMRHGTGGGWRAVDVLADGAVSRVAVQRADFRAVLAAGGGADRGAAALVADLNRKAAALLQ